MSRIRITAALALLLAAGCARSHDALVPDVSADAAGADAGASTGDPASSTSPVSCGPNLCYDGDVCCDALCGLCTAPGACRPERSCAAYLLCGSSCESGLCCPNCEGEDVCMDGDECPPLDCE